MCWWGVGDDGIWSLGRQEAKRAGGEQRIMGVRVRESRWRGVLEVTG